MTREEETERGEWVSDAWFDAPVEWLHPGDFVEEARVISWNWDVAEQTWAMWQGLA